jgi:hypothetical protein
VRYFLRRELFDEADEAVPERIRVCFVETDNPDEIVRPFCLGRGSCCDIAEYADYGRRYEIRGGGKLQVITLHPMEQDISEHAAGGVNLFENGIQNSFC